MFWCFERDLIGVEKVWQYQEGKNFCTILIPQAWPHFEAKKSIKIVPFILMFAVDSKPLYSILGDMNTPKDNKRNEVLNTKSVRKFRAYCKAQYGSEPSFELCAKLMHNFYFVTASLAGEFWKCDEIADEYREGNQ